MEERICLDCKWWSRSIQDRSGRLGDCTSPRWMIAKQFPTIRNDQIKDDGIYLLTGAYPLTGPIFGCVHWEERP